MCYEYCFYPANSGFVSKEVANAELRLYPEVLSQGRKFPIFLFRELKEAPAKTRKFLFPGPATLCLPVISAPSFVLLSPAGLWEGREEGPVLCEAAGIQGLSLPDLR